MSKIVCDICGTTYDDSAGACPVCGWSSGDSLDTSSADINDILNDDFNLDEDVNEDSSVQKGKAVFDYDAVNAHRRPRTQRPQPNTPAPEESENDDEEESGSNKFLVFILVILILALIGVSGYIAYTKLWKPNQIGSKDDAPQETIAAEVETEDATEETVTLETEETVETVETEATIPCTGLNLVSSMDTLTSVGQNWRLLVKYSPDDTTDTVTYSSGDESVVTVDEWGRVTAVGAGETVITITCGDQRIETPAVVNLEVEEATEATEDSDSSSTSSDSVINATPSSSTVLKLKKTDITIGRRGVYVTLELENGIAPENVKWSTSDSSIATVYNGNVTAIGKGTCVIRAEYDGQVAECIVRCKF